LQIFRPDHFFRRLTVSNDGLRILPHRALIRIRLWRYLKTKVHLLATRKLGSIRGEDAG